jgi:tetratricopeptide (TPR) repeat protein
MNRVMRAGIGLGLAIGAAVCLGQASQAPKSQRQTALALEQQGRNAEAEEDWRAILKAHPSDPEAYAHLGLLEARQEHYKEAVPFYRKAMALGPAVPGLRLNLGLALFKGGELKQAILEFTPLLKSQPPNSPEAQRLSILMGMAHYGLGEYAEAAPYLKQAAANDPSNLPLRLALAHSCLWSKQYQCVLDTYHEILALNSESAEADMLAGEAQDELRNSAGAIEQFRAAVKADPKEPNVHFGLGFLLWRLMQLPEAAQEFQAELVNNPDHGQALAYLADTEMKLGHPEAAPPPLEMAAQPLLEKSLRINPGLELVHLDLGILYVDAGRQDDALQELKEAARLAPKDVNVHWRLGRLYRSMGRKDEAKAEFEKASQVNKAEDQALFDRINSEHARPSQAQPPAPESPAK